MAKINRLKELLRSYVSEKDTAELAQNNMSKMRDELIDLISELGETTGKQSYVVEAGGIEGRVTYVRSAKVTEEAETLFRKLGVWDDVCVQVPSLEKIDEMFASGRIDAKTMAKAIKYGDPSARLTVKRVK